MAIPLRTLIIEDSLDDVELLLRELRKSGYEPSYRQVDNPACMKRALLEQPWDIVISDYVMPQFDGLGALQVLQDTDLDLPFIIVSGTIGEEVAVAAMKAGAHDYFMKGKLARLVPAIERELREAALRLAHRRAEEKIYHLAYHDALTGLLNRHEFEDRVAQALESSRLQNSVHAVCFIDLDQFKVINDTCGHVAGDELLKQLSRVIQDKMRIGDVLARLGGDEFGLLIENCTTEQAVSIAETIRQAIKKYRFTWLNKTFEISASMGVVHIDASSDSLAKILSNADVACFAAKDLGRNRVYIHEEGDSEVIQRHGQMQMVTHISHALEDDRFTLYQQLIAPLVEGQNFDYHYEVLIRMIDEQGDLLLPGQFMPAAERFNLMPTIDRWVIAKVLSIYKQLKLPDKGGNKERAPFIAINLSGASLGDDTFLDFVRAQMLEHEVAGDNFCFEITETAAIENLPKATRFIQELKTLGCRFSLDDFGSGLSSFFYLKHLPVDYLKIDGSFVREIATDRIDYTMVEAINRIGHVMNIHTIAEYVENEAILKKLKELGVDYGQGYAIAKPSPLEE